MSDLRPPAKAFVAANCLCAAAALLLALQSGTVMTAPVVVLAAVMAALVGLAWLFPLPISFKTQFYLDSIPLLAAVLLLPPAAALASIGLGVALAHVVRRRPLDESAFNTAQGMLQGGMGLIALAFCGWTVSAPVFNDPQAIFALASAAAVIYLTNELSVAGMVSLQTRQPLLAVWAGGLRSTTYLGIGAQAAQFGLGFVLAGLLWYMPWTVVLLAPVVVVVYSALGRQIELRRQLDGLLQDQASMLDEAQGLARIGSWIWDLRSGRHTWSGELYRLLGDMEPEPRAGYDVLHAKVYPADRAEFDAAVHAAIQEAGSFAIDHRVVRTDGAVRLVHSHGAVLRDPRGQPNRLVATLHDVTERRAWEARLTFEATHDQLTGLFNRAFFIRALERAITASPNDSAVLFLDLDCFKDINDRYGHQIGDELLIAVAERLRDAVRPSDVVARLGGDEFAILLQPVDNAGASGTADRLAAIGSAPYRIRKYMLNVQVSIGWTPIRQTHRYPEQALGDADQALYQAKRLGLGQVVQFTGFHGMQLPPADEDVAV